MLVRLPALYRPPTGGRSPSPDDPAEGRTNTSTRGTMKRMLTLIALSAVGAEHARLSLLHRRDHFPAAAVGALLHRALAAGVSTSPAARPTQTAPGSPGKLAGSPGPLPERAMPVQFLIRDQHPTRRDPEKPVICGIYRFENCIHRAQDG